MRLAVKREAFEDKFWSGIELSRLYQESQGRRDSLAGSETNFLQRIQRVCPSASREQPCTCEAVEGASRAMRISMNRELENLETHIPFLERWGPSARISGLFGTVWDYARLLSRWAQ